MTVHRDVADPLRPGVRIKIDFEESIPTMRHSHMEPCDVACRRRIEPTTHAETEFVAYPA